MNTLKCIAIDDEPFALNIIVEYIKKVPFLELIQTFDNAISAIDYLKSNEVDLIFLDIQMDEITGIQMLEIHNPNAAIIFTTAYDSYAIKSYEFNVVDYLLKPISLERFMKAVDKAHDFVSLKQKASTGTHNDTNSNASEARSFLFVKTEYRLEKVNFCDILFIEGQGDYLKIITTKKNIMTLQNFKTMEENLPKSNFIRVHKSYIVALDKIDSIERNRIYIAGSIIPVSETYKNDFNRILETRSLNKP